MRMEWWNDLVDKFILDFVEKDRWKYITNGLGMTMQITIYALLIGLVIGIFIAIVRTSYDQIGRKNLRGVSGVFLQIIDPICRLYLTVIRGTPSTVQLMLMYFVVFASCNNKILVASISFGINSVTFNIKE